MKDLGGIDSTGRPTAAPAAGRPRVDHAMHPAADRIVSLYAAGETIDDIAQIVVSSAGTVRRVLRAREVVMRSKGSRAGHRYPRLPNDFAGAAPIMRDIEPLPASTHFPHTARDACPFCGTRGEIGCRHQRSPLSMGAFA